MPQKHSHSVMKCNVQDTVGAQMMELYVVEEDKPSHEIVQGQRQTSLDKRGVKHALVSMRIRHHLVVQRPPVVQLPRRNYSHSGLLLQQFILHRGRQPVPLLRIARQDDGGIGSTLLLHGVRHHYGEGGRRWIAWRMLRCGCNGESARGRRRRSGVE